MTSFLIALVIAFCGLTSETAEQMNDQQMVQELNQIGMSDQEIVQEAQYIGWDGNGLDVD